MYLYTQVKDPPQSGIVFFANRVLRVKFGDDAFILKKSNRKQEVSLLELLLDSR